MENIKETAAKLAEQGWGEEGNNEYTLTWNINTNYSAGEYIFENRVYAPQITNEICYHINLEEKYCWYEYYDGKRWSGHEDDNFENVIEIIMDDTDDLFTAFQPEDYIQVEKIQNVEITQHDVWKDSHWSNLYDGEAVLCRLKKDFLSVEIRWFKGDHVLVQDGIYLHLTKEEFERFN